MPELRPQHGRSTAKPSVAILGTRGYPSYYGGFETAVRKLAPYLSSRGWDVTVYGRPGSTKNEDPGRDLTVNSVETRGIESKSLSTLSYGLTAALNVCKRRPDVVLVMNVANGFFLPLLKLRGIKTLVNVDGIEWDRPKWGPLAKILFRAGARMTALFSDELVVDAHEIGRRWQSDFKRTGIYIPYGGDPVPELPLEPGLKHRGYILLVARFVPENTVTEFLAAAVDISNHLPVVIVGSSGYGGPLEEEVERVSKQYPGILWLGHISDDVRLHSLWQHAAVYFHGHSVGGTNPTLVQSMAAGAPVVARDTPYNREVLPEGTVFFSPTANSIAEAVLGLARDPDAQQLASENNRSRALEVYTWDKVCSEYENQLTILAGTGESLRRNKDLGSTSVGEQS